MCKSQTKKGCRTKMLERIAKKSVDSVGKNPMEGTKNPNLNLNQQLGEIAKKNVLDRHVEDKRIGDNVLKGLQISVRKIVRERKNQRRRNQREGDKKRNIFY